MMALETGTYISDLVITNPTSTDPKSEGDNHLRLVKSTIKATFPNITGAVTATHGQLNIAGQYSGSIVGKNKIINGNFDFWQRGTSFTNPNNTYGADRWILSVGAGAGTASRQAFTPGQTDVPGNPTYFARLTATGTAGQNLVSQRIEGVETLSGVQATLSFWVKADSAFTMDSTYPQIRQDFGSGGSTQVQINNPGSAVNVTTSWQKVTRTFTLPSISGKTIGANNCLVILPVRRDGTAVVFDIAQVQFEVGNAATPFEERPLALEFVLCQRYYYRVTSFTGYSGFAITTTSARFSIPFQQQMRISPTALTQSGTATDYAVTRNSGVVVTCNAVPTFIGASANSATIALPFASGLTAGEGLQAQGSGSSILAFETEL